MAVLQGEDGELVVVVGLRGVWVTLEWAWQWTDWS